VNIFSPGAVTVTATLTDNCAGVDAANPPHLKHKINPTNPQFIDDGPMALQGGSIWTGTIPDPNAASHWTGYLGQTLQFQVAAMRDFKGNTNNSAVQSDVINSVASDTYAPCPPSFPTGRGTVVNCAQLQVDGGAPGELHESGATTFPASDLYGSTSGNSVSVLNPTNAHNVPDGTEAEIDATGDRLRVGTLTAPPAGEAVTKVELGIRARYTGTISAPTPDSLRLGYRFGCPSSCSNGGTSFNLVGGVDLPGSLATVYKNVTGDFPVSSWPTIFPGMEIEARWIANGGTDAIKWEVDSAWMRVTTTHVTYAMVAEFGFSGVPVGLQYNLQTSYQTSGDQFRVQVWEPSNSTWVLRGPALNSAGYVTWQAPNGYQLLSSEFNGGSPKIRFVDLDAPLATSQGHLYMDYLRVHTS
jgi:hypothetical protein